MAQLFLPLVMADGKDLSHDLPEAAGGLVDIAGVVFFIGVQLNQPFFNDLSFLRIILAYPAEFILEKNRTGFFGNFFVILLVIQALIIG